MAFDPKNSELRNASVRKAEFRELARSIVSKDRDCRRHGRSVDTGGEIARAMEQAYKLAVAHCADREMQVPSSVPGKPVPWLTIPAKARAAFGNIMHSSWLVLLIEGNGTPFRPKDIWGCYSSEDKSFERYYAVSTLAPLIKLGLMEQLRIDRSVMLRPTALAKETMKREVAEREFIKEMLA